MKAKAQSMVEFAVILLAVTLVAMISLHIISSKINSSTYNNIEESEPINSGNTESSEELNCTKMGLSWDKVNGVCEAK